jgi:hypothetical protein
MTGAPTRTPFVAILKRPPMRNEELPECFQRRVRCGCSGEHVVFSVAERLDPF